MKEKDGVMKPPKTPISKLSIYMIGTLTLEKDKVKAYKSNPKAAIFRRKIAASGGTRTHDLQRSQPKLYQQSYRGCSVG